MVAKKSMQTFIILIILTHFTLSLNLVYKPRPEYTRFILFKSHYIGATTNNSNNNYYNYIIQKNE